MNHWWRAYNEAVHDPKLQLISDSLFRVWFNLMCIASSNDGKFPALKDVAFTLRLSPEKAATALAQLHGAGLLDKTETGFVPHNWNGRQYKSDVSTERVKRYRNGKRNVSSTVTETVSKRPQIQTTDTEIETVAKATGAVAPPDPSIAEREYFARGREVLGKSAGGQLANLLKAKGGNVALARSAIETASQKSKPSEYVGAMIRAPVAKPLTEYQRQQHEAKDILDVLDDYTGSRNEGRPADLELLPDYSGERSQDVRGWSG